MRCMVPAVLSLDKAGVYSGHAEQPVNGYCDLICIKQFIPSFLFPLNSGGAQLATSCAPLLCAHAEERVGTSEAPPPCGARKARKIFV